MHAMPRMRARRPPSPTKIKHKCALIGLISLCICFIFLLNLTSLISQLRPLKTHQPTTSKDGICDRSLYPPTWELRADQVTILVNGFAESRIPLLQKSMFKYSASPEVHSIFVLWGNVSTPSSVLGPFSSAGSPIYVIRQGSTSLNDRFLPRPYIQTRAVMVCDDDITVELQDLSFALRVWGENQGRIVGFFPRSHSYNLQTRSWIYTKSSTHYSILLTKLMIIATEFLYLYTCEMPKGVKEYVDEGMNCEDIAMNFLVSSYGGQGPLLVGGNAQDWGDMRSSESDVNNVGLSTRPGHRKNRGDCIGQFQRLWGGVELRYSSAKAVADVDEEVVCEKFGVLIPCDAIVFSRREALRIAGTQIIASRAVFAYVTIVPSWDLLNASFVLAQSLRGSGTVHDLVALLHPSANVSEVDPVLQEHFDVVRRIQESNETRDFKKGFEKLDLWLMLEYTRVIYLDVEALVLSKLDHLFELSEFAAGSHALLPQYFDSGLMLLRPSNVTYRAMMDALERSNFSHLQTAEVFLNFFFSGWFEMPTSFRLPICYTAVIRAEYELSLGFDWNIFDFKLGNLAALRFPNLTFALTSNASLLQTCSLLGCNVWHQTFQALLRNSMQPFENESLPISQWITSTKVHSANLTYPNISSSKSPWDTTLEQGPNQLEAFVTVIYENSIGCIEGWIVSFQEYHLLGRSVETVLIVVSTVDEQQWRPYTKLFTTVVVVDPLVLNGEVIHSSFALLHLWNQTSYTKLVYVDFCSLFLKNCNVFLDYMPLAAMPNSILPDTFSTAIMVLQPSKSTYHSLLEGLQNFEGLDQNSEIYANFYFKDWHAWPAKHRISPSFGIDMRFNVQPLEHSTKLLIFSVNSPIWSSTTSWTPIEKRNVMKLWQKTFCTQKYTIQAGFLGETEICRDLVR